LARRRRDAAPDVASAWRRRALPGAAPGRFQALSLLPSPFAGRPCFSPLPGPGCSGGASMMNRAERLMQHAGHLTTSVGAAFPGSRAVFRGHDLHQELGHLSWFELCTFGITGRRLPAAQLKVLEFIWVNTSYPDARIWNNRVAALAGTTRSTPNLAITAGHALSEAMIYGRRNEFR